MCSTPSGIEANGTGLGYRLKQAGQVVLNAFRHRGERDWPVFGSTSGTPFSAQRLPASRRTGQGHAGKRGHGWWKCSTPSGIEANGTQLRFSPFAFDLLPCSTPSGIEANGTRQAVLDSFRRKVVLNAFRHRGERDGQTLPSLTGNASKCSTPSGIEANGTSPCTTDRPPGTRCSTPSGIEANGTTVRRGWGQRRAARAQRLPASRRTGHELSTITDDQWATCSTPSGIEANGTATTAVAAGARGSCSTPSGIEANGTLSPVRPAAAPPPIVLNAFRHRGERDILKGQNEAYKLGGCSTPSGIEANGTHTLPDAPRRDAHVLNAFRHRGERDFVEGVFYETHTYECSTPSGIEANGTGQRSSRSPRTVVLNAFRHRGERDWWAGPASRPSGPSAQRLPASRRTGPRLSMATGRRASSCSTPSGIEANGTARVPQGARVGVRVLNAFRHRGERDAGDFLLAADAQRGCSTPSGIRRTGPARARARRAGQDVLNAFRHRGERDRHVGAVWPRYGRVLNAFRHRGERDPAAWNPPTWDQERCSTPSGIEANGT